MGCGSLVKTMIYVIIGAQTQLKLNVNFFIFWQYRSQKKDYPWVFLQRSRKVQYRSKVSWQAVASVDSRESRTFHWESRACYRESRTFNRELLQFGESRRNRVWELRRTYRESRRSHRESRRSHRELGLDSQLNSRLDSRFMQGSRIECQLTFNGTVTGWLSHSINVCKQLFHWYLEQISKSC